jgi:hypothetical protein
MGIAVAGLAVAYFSQHIDRRRGILIALVLLAIPRARPVLRHVRLCRPAPELRYRWRSRWR